MVNTCGKCQFYEGGVTITTVREDIKESKPGGVCYGAPPTAAGNTSTYPTVSQDQRECALWRAIPPTSKGKRK